MQESLSMLFIGVGFMIAAIIDLIRVKRRKVDRPIFTPDIRRIKPEEMWLPVLLLGFILAILAVINILRLRFYP